MTKTFLFDLDTYHPPGDDRHTLEVEVEVQFSAHAEDDAGVDEITVWDPIRKQVIELETLSDQERSYIEAKADEVAYENAHEAWFEAQLARADAMYDSWKDGD